MTLGVDVGDVEAVVVAELRRIAEQAVAGARHAETVDGIDLDGAELSLELTIWTGEAEIVAAAITGIDERWRLASGAVELALQQGSEGAGGAGAPAGSEGQGWSLRELRELGADHGLVVISATPGSIRLHLSPKDKRRARSTAAVLGAMASFTAVLGVNVHDGLTAITHHHDQPPHRCELNVSGGLNADARQALDVLISRMPDGCTIKVEARSVGPSHDDHVRVEAQAAPRAPLGLTFPAEGKPSVDTVVGSDASLRVTVHRARQATGGLVSASFKAEDSSGREAVATLLADLKERGVEVTEHSTGSGGVHIEIHTSSGPELAEIVARLHASPVKRVGQNLNL